MSADKTIDLSDDPGFIEVKAGGEARRMDVWETYWRIMDANEGGPPAVEFSRRVAAVLGEAGLPVEGLSLIMAERFAAAIFERVAELKKKAPAGGGPASPGTTAPPP